uniref:Zinc finger GRF-type domain-containing protein n=2 Tax=Arabidopsis thaliana TaxID=3702 RepID=Q1PEB7_ARATH|nr:hypothetical protein At4g04525 [Arabidopsis thaliana]
MGLHSYTQPSESSQHSESPTSYGLVYPSQPSTPILGIPRRCYCGGIVVLASSSSEDNRQFYQCEKREARPGRHLVKWLDESLVDKIAALKCSVREQDEHIKFVVTGSNGERIDPPYMWDRLDLYQQEIKSLQHQVGLLERSPRTIIDQVHSCPPHIILVLVILVPIVAFVLGTYM